VAPATPPPVAAPKVVIKPIQVAPPIAAPKEVVQQAPVALQPIASPRLAVAPAPPPRVDIEPETVDLSDEPSEVPNLASEVVETVPPDFDFEDAAAQIPGVMALEEEPSSEEAPIEAELEIRRAMPMHVDRASRESAPNGFADWIKGRPKWQWVVAILLFCTVGAIVQYAFIPPSIGQRGQIKQLEEQDRQKAEQEQKKAEQEHQKTLQAENAKSKDAQSGQAQPAGK
jgi:hypothetical protein